MEGNIKLANRSKKRKANLNRVKYPSKDSFISINVVLLFVDSCYYTDLLLSNITDANLTNLSLNISPKHQRFYICMALYIN